VIAGPLALADDFWLATHDTPRGESSLKPRPLGIGLATALLAELMLHGKIQLLKGRLRMYEYIPPEDPALLAVFNQLAEEQRSQRARQDQDVRQWIAFLSDRRAADLVEARLSRQSLIEQVSLGWPRKRQVWVPRQVSDAGWPGTRIVTTIKKRQLLTDHDMALAGLFLATGVNQSALTGLDAHDAETLSRQLRNSMHVTLRELVTFAVTAVGQVVMTR
jgi:hypothetical protein